MTTGKCSTLICKRLMQAGVADRPQNDELGSHRDPRVLPPCWPTRGNGVNLSGSSIHGSQRERQCSRSQVAPGKDRVLWMQISCWGTPPRGTSYLHPAALKARLSTSCGSSCHPPPNKYPSGSSSTKTSTQPGNTKREERLHHQREPNIQQIEEP